MTGREPEKKNPYYSSRVTWLLLVLVGVALLVVGLTYFAGEDRGEFGAIDPWPDTAGIIRDTIKTASESKPADEAKSASIPWRTFNQAISDVEGESRFVMIFFSTADCTPCDQMESGISNQPRILEVFEHKVLPVRVESYSNERVEYSGRILSESGLADIFGISGYPTLMFYDGQTREFLFALPGLISADKLNRIFEYLRGRMFEDDSPTLQEYISR